MILVLPVKKQHILRRVKLSGERCFAPAEVCGKGTENMEPLTQADDAQGLPGAEASLPTLKTSCLSAINTNHCRLSLQNTVDFLKKLLKGQPPKSSQETGDRPIFKASEKNGEELWKKTLGHLNGNPPDLQSAERLAQETARWKQRLQEMEQEKERLEQSNAGFQQALNEKVSQLVPVGENLLKTFPGPTHLGDHLGHVNCEVEEKRETENDDGPIHGSEGDLKGVTDDADSNVSLQSAEGKKQELARQLQEGKQMNEELMGQITDLQAKEASLQRENSQLEEEIQQLKQKLQILPKLYQECISPVERKWSEAEEQCADIKWNISCTRRNIKAMSQTRDFYREIAEDTRRELEENSLHYQKGILFHAKRAQESWMAAVLTERSLKKLKKESDHNRQMFQLFPSGPFTPAPPPAAHRGPEVSENPWIISTPRKEKSQDLRAQAAGPHHQGPLRI